MNDHRKAAALLLIESRDFVPKGQWGAWLAENNIPERTARRLVGEYLDPQAEARRQEQQRQRDADERRDREQAAAYRAATAQPADSTAERAPRSRAKPPVINLSRARIVSGWTEQQWQAAHAAAEGVSRE